MKIEENLKKIRYSCIKWVNQNPPQLDSTPFATHNNINPGRPSKYDKFDLVKIKKRKFKGLFSKKNDFFFITDMSFNKVNNFFSIGKWFYSGHVFEINEEKRDLVDYVSTPSLIMEKELTTII